MDKMGAANEKMKNWAKALLCHEQTLLARSKYYGNTHMQVATSLVNVARVMELKDGTSEESLDLFRAANAIFALQSEVEDEAIALEKLASTKEEAKMLLETIPDALRQGNYDKAVEHLQQCLTLSDDYADLSLDRAQVFFDLGRAYMGLNDFKQASACLIEAVRNASDGVSDENVLAMMQNFDFLKPSIKSSAERDHDSAEGEDSFEDPPLSLLSIDLEMQKEEDEEEEQNLLERSYRARISKLEMLNGSKNPHHQILFESFVQEDPASPGVVAAPSRTVLPSATTNTRSRRTLRERVWTEKNRQLPAKLAKKLSDKVKALQKKKLPKKLKRLGSKYWKRTFHRTATRTSLRAPFRCVVNTDASLMVIEEDHHHDDEDDDGDLLCSEQGSEMKVLAVAELPPVRRVRSVLIEEETGGFSAQAQ